MTKKLGSPSAVLAVAPVASLFLLAEGLAILHVGGVQMPQGCKEGRGIVGLRLTSVQFLIGIVDPRKDHRIFDDICRVIP